MHEIVKYFILTEIRSEIDRRTLDLLKSIECRAGSISSRELATEGETIGEGAISTR